MLDRLGIHFEYTHDPSAFLQADRFGKRVVFLHRDPRDTAVSHWFQITRRCPKYSGTLSDFLRDSADGLPAVIRFNLAVKEQIDRTGNGIVLTYESLQADPAAQLDRIATVCGRRSPRRARLDEAVEAARFDRMRALEQSGRGGRIYGDALEPADPTDPASYKVREGRVGGWKTHLSPVDADYAAALLDAFDYFQRMRWARSSEGRAACATDRSNTRKHLSHAAASFNHSGSRSFEGGEHAAGKLDVRLDRDRDLVACRLRGE
jgi:hypothetical protein